MNRPEIYHKQTWEHGFTPKCASCDRFVYEPTKEGDGHCVHNDHKGARSAWTRACFDYQPYERMRL